ncbi:hypothetical protein ACOMHN_047844 [Nucella lapillus]
MSQSRKQWTKPNDIMRTRQKKRSNERSLADSAKSKTSKKEGGCPSNTEALQRSEDASRKRKNPFGISSPARRRPATESSQREKPATASVTSDGDSEQNAETKGRRLFSALNDANQKLQENTEDKKSKPEIRGKTLKSQWTSPEVRGEAGRGVGERSSGGRARGAPLSSPNPAGDAGNGKVTASIALSGDAESEDSEERQGREGIPLDWSLKVKLRIVFHTDLFPPPRPSENRTMHMTGIMLMEPSEERKSRAMLGFVHNKPLTEGQTLSGVEEVMLSLRQCCHYWVYPFLPGFPDFPRITTYKRDQVSLELGDKPEVQKVLLSSWLESIASVYEQVKRGQCPYFYMCAHHFTALFYVSVAGGNILSACVTPTTRGLREAMTREGVEFTMPYREADSRPGISPGGESSASLQKKSRPGEGGDEKDDDDDSDDLDITATNDGAAEWLKEVGLDHKAFPTLHPSKVKIQREGYQKVDGRKESLILCQYRSVQALYNYLINSRQLTAITGQQAGIPPTLIAPTPFQGATLKNNRLQHSRARVTGDGVSEVCHVLDITGPLTPHHLLNITAVMQDVPDLSADLTLNTHEPTLAFNFVCAEAAASVHASTPTGPGTSSRSPVSSVRSENQPSEGEAKVDQTKQSGGSGKRSTSGKSSNVDSPLTQSSGDAQTSHSPDPERVAASGSEEKTAECLDAHGHSGCEHCSGGVYQGLHPRMRHRLCMPTTLSTATALKEIQYDEGDLTWSC